jgi:NAD(P)-dependent dehydrogenase (short-subunit alcohol dehydrogenase family)
MASGKLADIDLSLAPTYIQSNLLATLYLLQPALPHLRKSKGKIVLVSSGASERGYQGWGLHSMAKAGMNSFCRTLANEEGDEGVNIWAIRPGVVDVSSVSIKNIVKC